MRERYKVLMRACNRDMNESEDSGKTSLKKRRFGWDLGGDPTLWAEATSKFPVAGESVVLSRDWNKSELKGDDVSRVWCNGWTRLGWSFRAEVKIGPYSQSNGNHLKSSPGTQPACHHPLRPKLNVPPPSPIPLAAPSCTGSSTLLTWGTVWPSQWLVLNNRDPVLLIFVLSAAVSGMW